MKRGKLQKMTMLIAAGSTHADSNFCRNAARCPRQLFSQALLPAMWLMAPGSFPFLHGSDSACCLRPEPPCKPVLRADAHDGGLRGCAPPRAEQRVRPSPLPTLAANAGSAVGPTSRPLASLQATAAPMPPPPDLLARADPGAEADDVRLQRSASAPSRCGNGQCSPPSRAPVRAPQVAMPASSLARPAERHRLLRMAVCLARGDASVANFDVGRRVLPWPAPGARGPPPSPRPLRPPRPGASAAPEADSPASSTPGPPWHGPSR